VYYYTEYGFQQIINQFKWLEKDLRVRCSHSLFLHGLMYLFFNRLPTLQKLELRDHGLLFKATNLYTALIMTALINNVTI
jgi:hypothetical protein